VPGGALLLESLELPPQAVKPMNDAAISPISLILYIGDPSRYHILLSTE
jgi:hypothetical protein